MPQRETAPRRPAELLAGGRHPWILVSLAGALSFVAMLDMTIVTIALADIAADLDVSASMAQWAVLGYQLAVVALLLPAGRWLDGGSGDNGGIGPRPALLLAVSGFALFSLVSAAAPWMAWLAVARIAQGCFAALLFVLMPVLVMRAVPPERRGRAMSVPATLGPLGAVTGPALGGVLLDAFGWRAVLLVKLPVCLFALLVVARVLPGPGRVTAPGRRPLTDAALFGGAVASLLLALTFAPTAPGWLLLALATVPLALWWRRRPGARPVVDAVRASGVLGGYAAICALAAGFTAMHYVVALKLQEDSGLSATSTGLTVLAFPLAMALLGPLGGRLADRYGPRPVAVVGAVVTASGLTLLALRSGDGWTQGDIAWRLAVAGAGTGLYGGPTQTLVMSAAPPGAMGIAGSLAQLSRSLGFALGPALASATWGMADSRDGARYALALAAAAVWSCVLLLSVRRPRTLHPADTRTATAPAGSAVTAAPAADRPRPPRSAPRRAGEGAEGGDQAQVRPGRAARTARWGRSRGAGPPAPDANGSAPGRG
ncbi:MFS transporter [Streptomyces sp. SAJ15]|uniref:MFS transporter n=1 Tax=Streptomyces sp. SAJ15 TaxID=2011095 RepID=UPI001185B6FA|nr:MFS transporter [Streptomyces sp. SAJ15]TVL94148.1 MFS transporter [Streptomyces sp. SAJ15]